jgi:hypothetical protein
LISIVVCQSAFTGRKTARKTSIEMGTGTSINGQLPAQTAVTLNSNTVTSPAAEITLTLASASVVNGSYLHAVGQPLDVGTMTFTVSRPSNTPFYRLLSDTLLSFANINDGWRQFGDNLPMEKDS